MIRTGGARGKKKEKELLNQQLLSKDYFFAMVIDHRTT